MLRINLLPDYVKQRRVIKQAITGFVIAAIFCVVAPLLFYVVKEKQLKDLTAKADAAVAGKAKTDASRALAASTLALVDPIKAKIDFVAAVLDYPRHWVQFYNTLADVTPRNSFIYSGTTLGAGTAAAGSSQGGYPGSSGAVTTASTGPNSVTIQAYSKSVAEVGRYLQAMYREPDFTTVAVDKVPGYPDNIRNLYYYGNTLVFADDATSTGTSSGGGRPGGYPGSSCQRLIRAARPVVAPAATPRAAAGPARIPGTNGPGRLHHGKPWAKCPWQHSARCRPTPARADWRRFHQWR